MVLSGTRDPPGGNHGPHPEPAQCIPVADIEALAAKYAGRGSMRVCCPSESNEAHTDRCPVTWEPLSITENPSPSGEVCIPVADIEALAAKWESENARTIVGAGACIRDLRALVAHAQEDQGGEAAADGEGARLTRLDQIERTAHRVYPIGLSTWARRNGRAGVADSVVIAPADFAWLLAAARAAAPVEAGTGALALGIANALSVDGNNSPTRLAAAVLAAGYSRAPAESGLAERVAALCDQVWRESQADHQIINDAGIMQELVERFRALLRFAPAADGGAEWRATKAACTCEVMHGEGRTTAKSECPVHRHATDQGGSE